jgi:ABC-type nickel/cobalt efflux system permease component RcnA
VDSIDTWLEGLMQGGAGLGLILLVSLLLGLRHASDPDHLAAVTTLIASDRGHEPVKNAASLGLIWGLGHGTTLVVVGLPFVLLDRYLPDGVVQAAEVAIGVMIVVLAVRLLIRWRRGMFHAHHHVHPGGDPHRHLHGHAGEPSHGHSHKTPLRTPVSAYAVGLVHGVGGSAGLTLLLIAAIPEPALATGAVFIFALGTALSMALLSTAFGFALARGPVASHFEHLVPAFGVLAAAFGIWYGLGALEVVAYPL